LNPVHPVKLTAAPPKKKQNDEPPPGVQDKILTAATEIPGKSRIVSGIQTSRNPASQITKEYTEGEKNR